MPRFTFADGRPNVAAPPRRAAVVRAGPPSAFQQLREWSERHRREAADIRAALRRVRAARRRPVSRPPVPHACPASTPRPREGGARMVAARGRGGMKRDDGSSDSDGGGGEPPPPPFAPISDSGRSA